MGTKLTGKLWVYIGTPLSSRPGNTDVMVCYVLKLEIRKKIYADEVFTKALKSKSPDLQFSVLILIASFFYTFDCLCFTIDQV